jgi:hypothetical protein
MENRKKDELPPGLAWSNTLVSLSGVSLMVGARNQFRELMAEKPDDLALQERVRDAIDEAREALAESPNSERMLKALGTIDDILPKK